MTKTSTKEKPVPTLTLPEIKTRPTLAVETAKLWVYGGPGVGKTTLAVAMADDALLLATDPRYKHLSVFAQDIDSWDTFVAVGKALRETDKHRVIVIDRVELLYQMCLVETMRGMGRRHPSDQEDFGQGWQAVGSAWSGTLASLCGLGRGVVFVSHEKTEEIKGFVPKNRVSPDMSGKAFGSVAGVVDFMLQCAVEQTDDGPRHVLHTLGTDERSCKRTHIPGGNPLPDVIDRPADDPAGPLRAALLEAAPVEKEPAA